MSQRTIERLMSAREMLTGLIDRSIAETASTDYRRSVTTLSATAARCHQFRGNWVNVDPSCWGDRVHDGDRWIGCGDEQQKMGSLADIRHPKEMVATDPTQSMVTPKQMYATLNDFINMNGLGDPEQYFLNPESRRARWLPSRRRNRLSASNNR